MVVWKRVGFGVWIWVGFFSVCDLSRVYEVLDFMFKADTGICGMASNLVELAITVWVIARYVWVWWSRDG